MSIIMDSNGNVIHRSRNLRGIREHTRRTPVVSVEIKDTDGRCVRTMAEWVRTNDSDRLRRYEYLVTYANGDIGRAFFADCRVALQFTRDRRSWGRVPVTSDVPALAKELAA